MVECGVMIRIKLMNSKEKNRGDKMDWYFNLDHDQCVGCGACVFVCTFNGQDILEMGYYPSPYDSELLYFCMDCDGHCLYVCPNEAIEIGKE